MLVVRLNFVSVIIDQNVPIGVLEGLEWASRVSNTSEKSNLMINTTCIFGQQAVYRNPKWQWIKYRMMLRWTWTLVVWLDISQEFPGESPRNSLEKDKFPCCEGNGGESRNSRTILISTYYYYVNIDTMWWRSNVIAHDYCFLALHDDFDIKVVLIDVFERILK